MPEAKWDKKHKSFNQKVVDRIKNDAAFRSALLEDAGAALKAAGLDRDLRELEELDLKAELSAVKCAPLSCVNSCNLTCKSNTCLFTMSC